MPAKNFVRGQCLSLFLLCSFVQATFYVVPTQAEVPGRFPGIAWKVKGQWQDMESGTSLVTGSLVQPGDLLQPRDPNESHSITILLPDGQRILNECFTAADCERSFRVPSLIESPSSFQVHLLARISHVLLDKNEAPFGTPSAHAYATPARLDEASAMLTSEAQSSPGAEYRVLVVASGISALSNGDYSYDLRKLDRSRPLALHAIWKKTSAHCFFVVPAPGLYELTIRDALEVPRVDLMLAVIDPKQRHIQQDFLRARKILEAWDDESYGWPVHLLLRAYLRSLFGLA